MLVVFFLFGHHQSNSYMYLYQYENIECIYITLNFVISYVPFSFQIFYICYFNLVHVDSPFSYSNIILLPCSNVNNFLFIEGSVELHLAYSQFKTT